MHIYVETVVHIIVILYLIVTQVVKIRLVLPFTVIVVIINCRIGWIRWLTVEHQPEAVVIGSTG